MSSMSVIEVPQEVLDSARMTVPELKIELAVWMYAQGKLSLGKARQLAELSLWEFRQLLASRRISPHLEPDDIDQDLATLRSLRSA